MAWHQAGKDAVAVYCVAKTVAVLASSLKEGVEKEVDEIAEEVSEEVPNKINRTLDELVPNGIMPSNSKVDNQFHKWFDELLPEELDLILEKPKYADMLDSRIRYPGGLHEWCMVCEIRTFKKWNIPMAEIHRFRTRTLDLTGKNPITGEIFSHGGAGSTTFHKELREAIHTSSSMKEFNDKLIELVKRWQIDPNLLPPLIK